MSAQRNLQWLKLDEVGNFAYTYTYVHVYIIYKVNCEGILVVILPLWRKNPQNNTSNFEWQSHVNHVKIIVSQEGVNKNTRR